MPQALCSQKFGLDGDIGALAGVMFVGLLVVGVGVGVGGAMRKDGPPWGRPLHSRGADGVLRRGGDGRA
jgi:hypothetical protein